VRKAFKVRLDQQVLQGLSERLAHREYKVYKALKGYREYKVQLGHKDKLVYKVRLAQLDRKE
jgi:hypothetical protein